MPQVVYENKTDGKLPMVFVFILTRVAIRINENGTIKY